MVVYKISSLVGFKPYWEFDNGVKMFKYQLIYSQIKRYKVSNLHEPDEEALLLEILNEIDNYFTFIDIGAAGGYYSILVKKNYPKCRVIAFNPVTYFFKYLKDNLKLNDLEESAIAQEKLAISDYSGKGNISRGWGGKLNSGGGEYEVTTLDKYFKKHSFEKGPIIVKMDIQGEELNALKGFSEEIGRVKYFVIGTHSDKLHVGCKKILENAGFELLTDQIDFNNQPDGLIIAKNIDG